MMSDLWWSQFPFHHQTDSDNVFNSTPSQSAQYANFNQVDPEDIFRMFFGMAICFSSS